MTRKLIAGIDYSLTNPSICIHPKDIPFSFEHCRIEYICSKSKHVGDYLSGKLSGLPYPLWDTPEERYDYLATWGMAYVHHVEDICIEDYAFAAKGRVFHIGENTGLLKYFLWRDGKSFKTIPPTVIKKFATGKGNANKDLMHKSFVAETGIDISAVYGQKTDDSPTSDIVDSYFIAKYCHANQ